MNANTFEDELLRFVGQLCATDAVTRDTPLLADGLIDSLRSVELMTFVESALGIVIPDAKLSMERFRSVADIVREFAEGATPPATPTDEGPLLVFGDNTPTPSHDGVAALVERGEITPAGNGCLVLRGHALALHGYFARRFERLAAAESAAARRYPTLLPLVDMQRTDYFKSFPQHATFCTGLDLDDATLEAFVADVKSGQAVASAAGGRLEAPGLVLSSALCYHCYREFAGRSLAPGLTVLTTEGRCFRNERGAFRTLDRCHEFTMREIVLLGDAAAIEERRMRLLALSVDIAASLSMAGTVEVATDLFFRGAVDGRARALHQRAQALKYELRVRMDADGATLALASFNLHEDYFGRGFDIRLADGAHASTGCVAFGIERWVSAFLAVHGATPSRWPADVRAACEALS